MGTWLNVRIHGHGCIYHFQGNWSLQYLIMQIEIILAYKLAKGHSPLVSSPVLLLEIMWLQCSLAPHLLKHKTKFYLYYILFLYNCVQLILLLHRSCNQPASWRCVWYHTNCHSNWGLSSSCSVQIIFAVIPLVYLLNLFLNLVRYWLKLRNFYGVTMASPYECILTKPISWILFLTFSIFYMY